MLGRVENTERKGQIAGNQHFFHNISKRLFRQGCKKSALCGKGLTLSQTNPGFYMSAVQVFWKHCGKREKLLITSNFSFSHSVFYPFLRTFFHFHKIWNCRLQTLSVWKSIKCVVWERVKLNEFDGSVIMLTACFLWCTSILDKHLTLLHASILAWRKKTWKHCGKGEKWW